jgi:hypothetical protein
MKTPIVFFVCLLPAVACLAAETPQQPDEIDKYIAQQRRNIENYYQSQLIELNQRAQSEIRMLEVADKALYSGDDSAYAGLAAEAEVAKVVLDIDSFGFRAPWYLEDKTEKLLRLEDGREPYGYSEDYLRNSPERFAVAHSRIAERKNRILANQEWETVKLQRQEEYALTAGLEQLENRLRENAAATPKVERGVVAGIVYSQDMPSAVIGGKIVHQGDKIGGVMVVKIHKDKVDFLKKNRQWSQRAGQEPAGYW